MVDQSVRSQFQRFLRGWWGRRFGPASLVFLMLLGLFTQFVLPAVQTHAAAPPSASITGGSGTFTNSNGVYARTGQTVSVAFTTTADSKIACAAIYLGSLTGPQVAVQSGNGPSWTFNLIVGSGALAGQSDGTVTLFAAAGNNLNKQGICNQSNGSAQTSYIQDSTAPTLSGPPTITPAPNGANWNNSTATVKLNLTDGAGSGIASTTYTVLHNGVQSSSGTYSAANGITVGDKGDGVYLVQYASTDNVGNADGAPFIFPVNVDATKPTIAGSQTPAANASGWNNTSVVVHFTCADALSGVASCTPDQTLSSEGNALHVTGTATDNAGNSQSTTYGPVKIDKTAPTLTGAPTTAPNANGWYNAPVTIQWTCADALSGVTSGACPANSSLSSEGSAVTASASVSDNAGNTTSATSQPVKIDVTAPTTSAVAPTGWNNTNVTVNLSAADNLSGVFATYYIVDGGAQQMGSSVAFSSEGDHTLQYWSVDNAGNSEAAHTIHVKIDKTPPVLIPGQTPPANANGWNNSNVTVTFACSDSLSGVASCPASQTVKTEGAAQQVSGTATDNAGNSATAYYSVNIDKTKPTISAATDRAPNGAGWYNAPVTVSFACADALSGLATSCPASQTLTEGANQSVSGSVTDMAGNTASASVSGVNIDTTAPVITGAPTTAPNANGWYSGDVTIHWTCSDALSGIAGNCPADTTIQGEGANLGASASVTDKAGNVGVGSVSGIQIDRTAPATIASSAPAGWSNTDVTINLSASDNLSGVDKTFYQVDGGATQTGSTVVINTDGKHTLTFWSVDNAGNVEDKTAAGNSVTIQVDKTPPTISGSAAPAPNKFGWNNSDVTVSFTCADATSGVAFCTPDTTIATEGAAQSVTGSATDNAGNTSLTTVGNINLDKTAPTLVGAPTTAANTKGWYNGDVTIHWVANDALSGVNLSTLPPDVVFTGEGAGLNVTASVKDYADNATTATSQSVNIDRTPPLITGAPTTSPSGTDADGNAWYKGDVTIHWTCSDPALSDPAHSAGSGVATCQADNSIAGEGAGLTTSGSATDNAGNTSTNASDPVNIDRTPPTTSISAPNDWTNNDVTVTLSAVDNLSGVKNTYYTINGGAQQTGSSFALTSEGTYTIAYWSEDYAGNVEGKHSAQVKIDKTAPLITHGQAPAANSVGWNNSDVTVTFTCSDPTLADGSAGSGVKTCDGAPGTSGSTLISTVGKAQSVTGTAVDNAGNTSSDTASVSIDKTPPTISGAPATPANHNGWYNTPVTIQWTCADALSGIANCQAPSVIASEGANQTAHGTATDAADNSASADSAPVNIDLTPPTISGAPTTTPNANGWYNSSVTIAWTCADALSGIDGACPANTIITSEGTALSATASVSDKAGNTSSASVSGINIDKTAPVTGWSAVADYVSAGGVKYYGEAFTVALSATDDRSGVDQTYYILDGGKQQSGTSVSISGEGAHSLQFWSVDKAGNVEAAQTQTFLIDMTAPHINATRTAANANGWNNGDVTVTFTCTDPALADGKPGSGVQTCTGSTTVTTEGAHQMVTGNATDNVNNGSSLIVDNINIDKTPPTISGATDRSANANGWYNADVTVTFTCADTPSGIDTCTTPQTLGEGKNQSVTGTAVDLAGNKTTASVSGINIDKTAPTLSGAPTTTANANGWYNGDVAIAWTCADALSGIDGACPANTVITGEGNNLSAQATVNDKAGNTTLAEVNGVKIDRTPPVTAITAPNDWTNGDVHVTLSATDNLSGIATTFYTINGGGMQSGNSFDLTSEGVYTIQYWSMDNAGNSETAHTAVVKIDKTAPTITHQQAPTANANLWNNTDVTVTFTCADPTLADGSAGSGVKSCDGAAGDTGSTTVTTQGAAQQVIGTATDNAGNSANDTATLSIDKTPPTISAAPDRAPNANGWYNAPVTITFTCADALSGTQSCSAPVTLNEGANQSATGTAIDKADNSASTTYGGVNVDTTAPTLAGAATTSPNANGWYNGDVTIHWTCADALSGIDGACPADTTLTGEGSAVAASASVSDKAGNVTAKTVTVNIDRTAPVTTANYPGGVYGSWYNGSVAITLSATDSLSGPAATYYTVDGGATQTGTSLTVSGNGKHTVAYWSVDKADNEEVHHSAAIWIDTTNPTISGATIPANPNGANGWFTSPVTVHFTCADADSGVQSCAADQTLPNDGANQVVTGIATDNVGNTANATVKVNIDQTSPSLTVSVGGNTFTDGGAHGSMTATHTIATLYTLGSAPKVSCAATDATSGLAAPCAGSVSGGTSNGVGTFTYTATATDNAGNTTKVVVTYQVTYAFSGFLQPVNYTAHQIGASSSTFKAGSTVPFKFQLRASDGSIVQSGGAPLWIDPLAAGPTSGSPSAGSATAPVTTSDGGAYRWDTSGQQYIYTWSTSGLAASTWYRVGVKLDDGQVYLVYINLR